MTKLQIITVNFKSKNLIKKNIEITKKLNPKFSDYEWIVANNDFHEDLTNISSDTVKVIPGLKSFYSSIDRGSYHHAAALNMALKHVSADYLLIIDPDFFVMRKDWIQDLLSYMSLNKLVFFGSTWDPFNYLKYQNFPSVHFMLINLKRINLLDLNFSPNILKSKNLKNLLEFEIKNKLIKKFLKQASYFLLTEKSFDTGFLINQAFKHKKSECLKFAVYQNDLVLWNKLKGRLPKLFNNYLFKKVWKSEKNLQNVSGERVGSEDEFWWKEQLFGIHLRRVRNEFSKKNKISVKVYGEKEFLERAEALLGSSY